MACSCSGGPLTWGGLAEWRSGASAEPPGCPPPAWRLGPGRLLGPFRGSAGAGGDRCLGGLGRSYGGVNCGGRAGGPAALPSAGSGPSPCCPGGGLFLLQRVSAPLPASDPRRCIRMPWG